MVCMVSAATWATAETLTTKDYFVLSERTLEFTGGTHTVTTESTSSQCNLISVPAFAVNYPGNSQRFFKYDGEGNLIYHGSYFQTEYIYIPFENQVQWLPKKVETGKTYTIITNRRDYGYASCRYEGTGSDTLSIAVTGPETVNVPAGTYTTYKFSYIDVWETSAGGSGVSRRTFWLAKDVGWVKIQNSSGTYELKVDPNPKPLKVDPVSLEIETGKSGSCTISGGTPPYTVSSGAPSVATVAKVTDEQFTVTGVGEGTTTITVTDSNSVSVSVGVTVRKPAELKVEPVSLGLSIGESGSCTISGGTPPYTFFSNNPSVATVAKVTDEQFTVTGVGEGTATITVKDSNSGSVSVVVTVRKPAELKVEPVSLVIEAGESGSCTISGGTPPYTFFSNSTSVATVAKVTDEQFNVTGVSVGKTTITVKDSNSGSVSVGVTVESASSLKVSPESLKIDIGYWHRRSCTITGGTPPYTVSSNKTGVANVGKVGVNGKFVVWGVSKGRAIITVTDNLSVSVFVYVAVGNPPAEPLKVEPASLVIETKELGYYKITDGTQPYAASSNNTGVATVKEFGNAEYGYGVEVTGVSEGKATITVTDSNSGSVSVGVAVVNPAGPPVVAPLSLEIETGKSGSCTISGGTPPYTVISNNESVATVAKVTDEQFNVTGVSVGTTTITVTDSNSVSVRVGVTVTIPLTPPTVEIEANFEKELLEVQRGVPVTFCFTLDPGGYEGITAEYWFAAEKPPLSEQWLCPTFFPPSMTPCDQNLPRIVATGPIAEYGNVCFLTLSNLDPGTYMFYLMVKWDEGYVYDQVEVNVLKLD